MKLSLNFLKLKDNKLFTLSALGAFLFAVSLWVYTSLNDEYLTRVDVPLRIKLPENRAPETQLPSSITLLARGSGWDLFNLDFFNKSKVCEVDLSKKEIGTDKFDINRSTIEKSLRNVNVATQDIFPDNISVVTGASLEKRIPITSRIEVYPDENFIVATKTRFSPDSIIINGNSKVLSQIESWPTDRVVFDGINKTTITTVGLKDTLSTLVNVNVSAIVATVDVQQFGERTIYDVPLQYKNRERGGNEQYSADKVDITIRGGVKELSKLRIRDIKAFANFHTKKAEHIVQPDISLPDQFSLIQVKPRYIHKYRYKSRLRDL